MSQIIFQINQAHEQGREPCLIFNRVSSFEQSEGTSLEWQEEQASRYAELKKLYPVKVFTVTETGYKQDYRKLFNECVETSKQYQIKHIIFKSADRISRNLYDLIKIKELINEYLHVHLTDSGQVIHKNSNAMDKWVLDLLIILAQRDSDFKSDHLKNTNHHKTKRGVSPRTHEILGYKWDRNNRKWDIDDDTKDTVMMIFDTYDNEQISVRGLASRLNSLGIKNARGRIWSKTTLHNMLVNRFYAGEFIHNGEVHQGIHPTYITLDRFEKRMSRMGIKYISKKSRKEEFIWKGMLRYKGRILSGVIHKGKYIHYTTQTDEYKLFKEQDINDRIDYQIALLKERVVDVETLKKLIYDTITITDSTAKSELSIIQNHIAKLKQRSIRMIDLLVDDMDNQMLRHQIKSLRMEREQLEELASRLRERSEQFIFDTSMVIDTISRFPYIWENALGYKQKASSLRELADYVEITDDEAIIHWKHNHQLIINIFKDGKACAQDGTVLELILKWSA